MNWKKENPDLNRRWTQLETKKFLKAMRNHQLLWIPYIFPKIENDMVVKAAQDRLIEQTKRPWTDIAYQLAKLRFLFRKETKNWRYYKEMKRSLTVDGKIIDLTEKSTDDAIHEKLYQTLNANTSSSKDEHLMSKRWKIVQNDNQSDVSNGSESTSDDDIDRNQNKIDTLSIKLQRNHSPDDNNDNITLIVDSDDDINKDKCDESTYIEEECDYFDETETQREIRSPANYNENLQSPSPSFNRNIIDPSEVQQPRQVYHLINGDQHDIGINSGLHWLSPYFKNIEKKLREIEEKFGPDRAKLEAFDRLMALELE